MFVFSGITPERPLLLVGGGRMGSALVDGWIIAGLGADCITVIEPNTAVADWLRVDEPGLTVFNAPAEISVTPSVVVLAVKPQVMDEALAALSVPEDAVVLSIAAGKTLGYFASRLGDNRPIVRAMPNTPAAIAKGMTVCVANGQVSDEQRTLCGALMQAVGQVAWLDDETKMDAVTALSGSGPAYVFYLIECMAAAGEAVGLPRETAEQLARQTVAGAGALVEASAGRPPAELRQNVTSPGGTTEAALSVLMAEDGLAPLMRAAIKAAAKRSQELSG